MSATPLLIDAARWDAARWPNFSPAELRCKGTGLLAYDARFLDRLQALRLAVARPFKVTSGTRALSHNTKVGGHARSLHIGDRPQHPGQAGALAIDIAVTDGAFRGELFARGWDHGFSLGWNARAGFLHLDLRTLLGLEQTTFDY